MSILHIAPPVTFLKIDSSTSFEFEDDTFTGFSGAWVERVE